MAIYKLPVNSKVAHQSFEVELEGDSYGIELRWNNRAQSWFMTFLSGSGEPLLAGRRVTVGTGLIGRYRTREFPAGELVAYDTTGQYKDPGPTDMGSRVELLYIDSTSL